MRFLSQNNRKKYRPWKQEGLALNTGHAVHAALHNRNAAVAVRYFKAASDGVPGAMLIT